MPGASGDLSLRTLVTYVGKMTLDDGRTVTELAGSTDQPTIASLGGTPRWRANANATYKAGPTTLSLTGRYVGGGHINNAFTYKDLRSEERRVGKECSSKCRSRGSPAHDKTNTI